MVQDLLELACSCFKLLKTRISSHLRGKYMAIFAKKSLIISALVLGLGALASCGKTSSSNNSPAPSNSNDNPSEPAATNITYGSGSFTFASGVAIAKIAPTIDGSVSSTFTEDSANTQKLADIGLSLNAQTGVITGTPTQIKNAAGPYSFKIDVGSLNTTMTVNVVTTSVCPDPTKYDAAVWKPSVDTKTLVAPIIFNGALLFDYNHPEKDGSLTGISCVYTDSKKVQLGLAQSNSSFEIMPFGTNWANYYNPSFLNFASCTSTDLNACSFYSQPLPVAKK